MQKTIPYGRHSISDEDIQSVVDVLKSEYLTQGPSVEEFELKFSKVVNSKYAVAVSNGTAALHLAALSLGVQSGDKILCVANSFAASANCIRYCGGDVEFVDINPNTFCADTFDLKNKIETKKYKGVVIVDFAGYPALSPEIRSICSANDVWIIEDACHAVGGWTVDAGTRNAVGSGLYSDVTVFSFHPVKHIATGEGGIICTNSEELYNKLKKYRSHGITKNPSEYKNKEEGPWYHEMQALGFNYRIPDILCTLGLSQLSRLENNILRRKNIAQIYREELKNYPISFQKDHPGHAYHLMVAQTENKPKFFSYLKECNIVPQVHYIPIYKHPYYEDLYGDIKLINCEVYYKNAISLPMYHGLTNEDLDYVISKIKSYFKSMES